MSAGAVRAALDGGRWHYQHGPIDLIIGAHGSAKAVEAALEDAWQRFRGVLAELVAELPRLRTPVGQACDLSGPVARRMWDACAPYRERFITPMAAVAGSVAQEIAAFFARPGIERAWVNNGGDIALWLADGQRITVAVCDDPRRLPDEHHPAPASLVIDAASPVRGVATSGWRGRSFSMGIADAVTVLADTAARADAAATMIANAVDCEHPAVVRRPACELADDTDLGERLVTVAVGALPPDRVEAALDAAERVARGFAQRGLIAQALLSLQGRSRIVAP